MSFRGALLFSLANPGSRTRAITLIRSRRFFPELSRLPRGQRPAAPKRWLGRSRVLRRILLGRRVIVAVAEGLTVNWRCSSSSASLEIAVMNDMRGQRRPYHNSAPPGGSTSSGLGAASRHQLLGIPSRSLLLQLHAPSENNEVRIDSAPRV